MKLFIQIVDGKPFEHPIMEMNFKSAFPEIDINNLPPQFAEFIRHPEPKIGPYQIYQGVNYEWVNGKVEDVHLVREMIESERQDKIDFVKNQWATGGGFASWIFNEGECRFDPPVPYPEGDQIHVWDEATISWKPIQAQTIGGT